jgi:hypothetical protein
MSDKQTDFFKEPITPKRRQRLTDDEKDIIRLLQLTQIKPQINVDLPYREAPIMTPRHSRK